MLFIENMFNWRQKACLWLLATFKFKQQNQFLIIFDIYWVIQIMIYIDIVHLPEISMDLEEICFQTF
jgi:hypothetical protein